jgi:uncharacterized protein (UPF0335 family)
MTSPIGHNKTRVGGLAVEQLKSIIARVEKLTEEKEGIAADIRDVFAEAAGNGLDVKAIRTILKLRRQDASEREEAETILDVYKHALGMVPQFEMFDDAGEQESEAALVGTEEPTSDDQLYSQAVAIVVRDRKASPSYLQRMLKTGYNRAAQMIEQMEREGIVGPANHVGKREVLREPEGEVA